MLGGYKEKKKKFHFIFRTLALESAAFSSCSGAGKWWRFTTDNLTLVLVLNDGKV